MPPSHEREHSLFGEHCSVVRLNEGSILYVWKGWINAQWRGTTLASGRASPTVDCCLDRSVRLSSLTCSGCQFASSFVLSALPFGLRVICSRDRCNLNYSFFGLRLCPYERKLAS